MKIYLWILTANFIVIATAQSLYDARMIVLRDKYLSDELMMHVMDDDPDLVTDKHVAYWADGS